MADLEDSLKGGIRREARMEGDEGERKGEEGVKRRDGERVMEEWENE